MRRARSGRLGEGRVVEVVELAGPRQGEEAERQRGDPERGDGVEPGPDEPAVGQAERDRQRRRRPRRRRGPGRTARPAAPGRADAPRRRGPAATVAGHRPAPIRAPSISRRRPTPAPRSSAQRSRQRSSTAADRDPEPDGDQDVQRPPSGSAPGRPAGVGGRGRSSCAAPPGAAGRADGCRPRISSTWPIGCPVARAIASAGRPGVGQLPDRPRNRRPSSAAADVAGLGRGRQVGHGDQGRPGDRDSARRGRAGRRGDRVRSRAGGGAAGPGDRRRQPARSRLGRGEPARRAGGRGASSRRRAVSGRRGDRDDGQPGDGDAESRPSPGPGVASRPMAVSSRRPSLGRRRVGVRADVGSVRVGMRRGRGLWSDGRDRGSAPSRFGGGRGRPCAVGGVGGLVDLAERRRPARAATRAQSSYSGLNVGGRPSSQPSFPLTGPNGVVDLGRLPLQLVPADRVAADAQGGRLAEEDLLHARRSSARRRGREIITPGRFFFIWIGVTKASSAPAAMSCVVV